MQTKESKKRCSQRRKKLGLCRDCPRKSRVGKTKCEVCFNKDLKRQIKWLSESSWRKAARARQKAYGLTIEQYIDMLFNQFGKCGVCDNYLRRPHVDHDHKTKKVRGLLCTRCNTSLWLLEDLQLVKNIKKYLKGEKKWQILK